MLNLSPTLQPEVEQGRRTSLEKFTRSVVSVSLPPTLEQHSLHDMKFWIWYRMTVTQTRLPFYTLTSSRKRSMQSTVWMSMLKWAADQRFFTVNHGNSHEEARGWRIPEHLFPPSSSINAVLMGPEYLRRSVTHESHGDWRRPVVRPSPWRLDELQHLRRLVHNLRIHVYFEV